MHCSEDKTTGERVDLSIIIVNYNTCLYLTMCLKTLFTHPPTCSFEILVVDNASGDGSAELVRVKYPDVRLIVNRYNYGFSVANNQAYRESRGRYVMTLNPDTEIPPGTIDRLVQFLDTRPDVGLVSPAILAEDGGVQAPDHSFPRFCRPVLLAMLGASVEPSGPQATIEAPWIFGTGYICRKEAIPSERFFDEDTFLFGEEYGLCRNMKRNGFKLYILPYARIRHHVSVSFKRDAGALAMAQVGHCCSMENAEAAVWLEDRDGESTTMLRGCSADVAGTEAQAGRERTRFRAGIDAGGLPSTVRGLAGADCQGRPLFFRDQRRGAALF